MWAAAGGAPRFATLGRVLTRSTLHVTVQPPLPARTAHPRTPPTKTLNRGGGHFFNRSL